MESQEEKREFEEQIKPAIKLNRIREIPGILLKIGWVITIAVLVTIVCAFFMVEIPHTGGKKLIEMILWRSTQS